MFKKIIFVSLGLLLITGCTQTTSDTNQNKTTQKRSAPKITLESFNGDQVHLGNLNKPAVINSWAGWCAFCKEELPDFAQAQTKFKGQIKIIAVNRAESKQKAKGYADDLGVTNKLTFLLDPKDKFYQRIGGFSMPETIFVNSKGEIILHKRGPMEFEEIKKKIEQHLLKD